MEIEGLKALVTGGATRIGRAICLGLAERGARVAIHFHGSEKEARAVGARCPGSVILQADLAEAEAADALVSGAHDALGGLDLLVNNAAIYKRTPLREVDEETWQTHLDLNLTAPFFAARAAGRLMLASGRGLIINLTDWAIARPHPDFLPYYAAKAGLAAVTAGLARALAPQVRVNAIAPGPILPPQGADEALLRKIRAANPLGRMGGEAAVVSTVVFLIGNEFVTGATLAVDGGRSLC